MIAVSKFEQINSGGSHVYLRHAGLFHFGGAFKSQHPAERGNFFTSSLD